MKSAANASPTSTSTPTTIPIIAPVANPLEAADEPSEPDVELPGAIAELSASVLLVELNAEITVVAVVDKADVLLEPEVDESELVDAESK
jgi:hypothetical protein